MKFLIISLLFLLACIQYTEAIRIRKHQVQQFNKKVPSLFKYVREMRFIQKSEKPNKFKAFAAKLRNFSNYRFAQSKQSADEMLAMAIAFQGWVKFFVFDDKAPLDKIRFFENPDYTEQKKIYHPDSDWSTDDEESPSELQEEEEEEEGSTTSDEWGSIRIPAKDEFYFVLNKLGLFCQTNRRNDIAKTQRSIHMNSIKPIIKTKKGLTGGLEDIGNFKEGFCYKVITGAEESWIMCNDSLTDKLKWMDAIIKIKGALTIVGDDEPEVEGMVNLGPSPFDGISKGYKQTGPDGEQIETKLKGLNEPPPNPDGHWKVLQDWSTCTLACGGGTQTLHRVCIEPTIPDGLPCIGEAILTKECNTDPCPEEASESEEEMDLKIKIMKVSYRPQRYETCIIKEGDLDVVRTDLTQFVRPPRVPTRVVLNNMTFTVFQTEAYENVLFSCPLDTIGIQAYDKDEACFTAFDQRVGTPITLCTLETTTNIGLKENRDEWVKEIGFFKEHCYKELKTVGDLAIAKIKAAAAEEEEDEAKSSNSNSKAPPSEAAMGAVSNMAVDAMAKEAKYEQLAEQEELDREILEEFEARKRLEELKAKDECLDRDNRKAAGASRGGLQEAGTISMIDDMKGNIKNMILNQRAQASKKIEIMKKLANRKKRASDDQLQDLRVKMAKQAMAAAKLGDISKCHPNNPIEEKNLYCNREFDTDPGLNQDCKDPDSFCYVCCENEAGVKHVPERTECFSHCTVKPKGGNWIWVPEANAVKA